MGEIKLKPCPFCGGTGAVKYEQYWVHSDYWIDRQPEEHNTYYCECTSCGVKTPNADVVKNNRIKTFEELEKAKRQVIESWNKRAGEDGVEE